MALLWFCNRVWSSLWIIVFTLQLHIADGIEAVGAIARNASTLPRSDLLEENLSQLKLVSRESEVGSEVGSEAASLAEGHGISKEYQKLHILIIDADSEDPR